MVIDAFSGFLQLTLWCVRRKRHVCLLKTRCLPFHFIYLFFVLKLLTLELHILQINTLIANGDKTSLRKAVTENMYSVRITFSFCFSSYGCFEIEFSSPRFLYLLSYIKYTDCIFWQGNKFFVGFVTDAELTCYLGLTFRHWRMKSNSENPNGAKFTGKWLFQWLRSARYELDWQVL